MYHIYQIQCGVPTVICLELKWIRPSGFAVLNAVDKTD